MTDGTFNLRQTGKDSMVITRQQWEAIKKVYARHTDTPQVPFQQFVDSVQGTFLMDGCIMLPWCGMWLGIEKDGHTHS